MSNTFTKAVLKVGTYESPDGTIGVTRERLRHWETQVNRLQGAGYDIPMHWDHAPTNNLEKLSPIRMDTSDKSAKDVVGKLVDFKVAPSGDYADLTVQTLTESAREKASANVVQVSPVILESFKDGHGNTYSDLFGSIDFVTHPVDHSQTPFKPAMAMSAKKPCVLRMSAAPNKIYRLSGDPTVDEEEKKPEDSTNESEAKADVDTPEEKAEEKTQEPKLQKCIDSLSQLGIVLADDTTVDNFLERLETGLDTYNALQGNQGPATADEGTNTVVDPGVATMSAKVDAVMSAKVRQLEDKLLEGEKHKLRDRLKACLDSGRCTPAEFDLKQKALMVTRMSLAKDNSVEPTDASKWIESREAIPKGACWDDKKKIQSMSAVVSEPPEAQFTSQEAPDVEALKAQSRMMLGR